MPSPSIIHAAFLLYFPSHIAREQHFPCIPCMTSTNLLPKMIKSATLINECDGWINSITLISESGIHTKYTTIESLFDHSFSGYTVTFFAAKPPKKRHRSPISCGKAIEEGDGSCHLCLLCFNGTITKQTKRRLCVIKKKKNRSCHRLLFFVFFFSSLWCRQLLSSNKKKRKRKGIVAMLPLSSSLS